MPRRRIHPGEIRAEKPDALGVSQATLARQNAVRVNGITQIVHGHHGISSDTALRLGRWFAVSPQFWRNLQGAYEPRRAEAASGAAIARLPVRPAA